MLHAPCGRRQGEGASPSPRSGRPRPDRLNIRHATTRRIRVNEGRHPSRAAAAGHHCTGARHISSEIDAANAKWIAAFNKGDAAAVAQLYTERATALPPGAPMAKGRAAIQAFWDGAIKGGVKNVTLKSVQVNQFGNAAREIGEFSLDAPNAQQQITHEQGKYVVLWRNVGGGWKLDTDIWNGNQ
jgi:uncharacterized protein (TIGR02246 family)